MPDDHGQDSCALLGDDFGIFVQIVLAVLAFSSLFFKWIRERPRRAVKVWLFDISKQALGASFQHFYNLLFAFILGGLPGAGGECQWYFLNISVDTTLGVLLMYIGLQLLKYWARKKGYRNLVEIGDYGYTAGATSKSVLKRWFQQLAAWIGIVLVAKVILSIVVGATAKWLQEFTGMIFWPLYDYPKVELVIVMIIVPLLLNLLQFWVVDNFLKKAGPPQGLEESTAVSAGTSTSDDAGGDSMIVPMDSVHMGGIVGEDEDGDDEIEVDIGAAPGRGGRQGQERGRGRGLGRNGYTLAGGGTYGRPEEVSESESESVSDSGSVYDSQYESEEGEEAALVDRDERRKLIQ